MNTEKLRVFVVDDEPDFLDMYAEMIEDCGHSVAGTSGNGAEAVERFCGFATPPDLVIMDNRMPLKSGVEAAREILQSAPQTPIVLVSGDPSTPGEALGLDIMAIHSKPLKMDVLTQILKSVEAKAG